MSEADQKEIDKEVEAYEQQIFKSAKWVTPKSRAGGQQAGIVRLPAHLVCEHIEFEVKVGYSRSQMTNRNLAWTFLELAVHEYLNDRKG